jgi:hypothetical protein
LCLATFSHAGRKLSKRFQGRIYLNKKTALDSHVKRWMQLERNTYLNAHAMSIHITFSQKKAAMKVNWIMNAARRTQSFR